MRLLLKVTDLKKRFADPAHEEGVTALDGVSFEVKRGESFGIVGESGAGKSTLARCLLGLERPDSGSIVFDGREITRLEASEWKELRPKIQIIWQDPYAYLNPYMRAEQLVREPLDNYPDGSREKREERVNELFRMARLDPVLRRRYPHELSGGQCQRVAIARALALNPDLILCDESLSSLDTPNQIRIIELLGRLQKELGTAYLFISHDLELVRRLCSRIAVFQKGRIVEAGPTERIFRNTSHPYTQLLLSKMLPLHP